MKTCLAITLATTCLFPIPPSALGAKDKADSEDDAHYRKIYHFEHRLLPGWTHGSDGAFLADLRKGAVERLREAARDVVGDEFARAITVRPSDEVEGVMIVFAKPPQPVACYFAFVAKDAGAYRYFTLEMTEDLFGTGVATAVGEWTSDGSHRNLGFRKTVSEDEFLSEVLALLKKGRPAATNPASASAHEGRSPRTRHQPS